MNTKTAIASVFLLATGTAAAAQAPKTTRPVVQVRDVPQMLDCQACTPSSQRRVGEWTGQYNPPRSTPPASG